MDLIVIATTLLIGLTLIVGASLAAFQQWLTFRQHQLDRADAAGRSSLPLGDGTTQRIDIADIKERLRRLEAIAAGVDL